MKKLLLILLLTSINIAAFSQWSNDPLVNTPITTGTGSKYLSGTVSSNAGSIISLWSDGSLSGYDVNNNYVEQSVMYANKISAAGLKLWGQNGVRLTLATSHQPTGRLISDGAGGAFAVWEQRSGSLFKSYIQKLDQNGNRLWGDNGILISGLSDDIYINSLLLDNAGGCLVTFEHYIDATEISNVYVQRFDADGVKIFAANGILVNDNASGYSYGGLLFKDDFIAGDFVIGWEEGLEDPNLDYEGSIIYMQKFNANGTRKTPNNAKLLEFLPSNSTGTYIQGAISNNNGGFYFSIIEENDSQAKLYIQQTDQNGAKLFGTGNGMEVDGSIGKLIIEPTYTNVRYSSTIIPDNNGGAIIAWTDTRSGNDGLFAQRFNASGVKQWNVADQTLAPGFVYSNGDLNGVKNADGDFVFLFTKRAANSTNDQFFAQKIGLDGSIKYTSSGKLISNAESNKFAIQLTEAVNKVVVTWSDSRNGDYNVYAQSVFTDGTLPIELLSFDAIYENNKVNIKWVTLSEKDNSYFELQKSYDGINFYTIGKVNGAGTVNSRQTYFWDDNNLLNAKGIVYYQLKQVDLNGKFSYSNIKAVKIPSLKALDISYYPNPIKEKLKIDLSSLEVSGIDCSYTIVDLSGKVVVESKSLVNDYILEVDMSQIPAGTYILSLKAANKLFTQKLIKN